MRAWMWIGLAVLGIVAGCSDEHTRSAADSSVAAADASSGVCRSEDMAPPGLELCTQIFADHCGDISVSQVCDAGVWVCPGTTGLVHHCRFAVDAGPPDAGSFTCPDDPSSLIGQTCSDPEETCGTCTDPCGGGICNLVRCDSGTWQREFFGCPAIGFACGPTLHCEPSAQYCERFQSDIGGEPDTWSCIDFPADCPTTCACFSGAPGPGTCTESDGDVTMTFAGG